MDFFGFTNKSWFSSNDIADYFHFGVKLKKVKNSRYRPEVAQRVPGN